MKWWRWLSRLSDDKLPPNMLRHILDDISVSVYLRYGEKMNVSQSVWCVAALTWIFRARMSMSEFSDRIQPYPQHWCQCTEHCPKQRSICFSFKNVDDKNSDAYLRRTHIHTPYILKPEAMGTKQSDLSIANWIFFNGGKEKIAAAPSRASKPTGIIRFSIWFSFEKKIHLVCKSNSQLKIALQQLDGAFEVIDDAIDFTSSKILVIAWNCIKCTNDFTSWKKEGVVSELK